MAGEVGNPDEMSDVARELQDWAGLNGQSGITTKWLHQDDGKMSGFADKNEL